MKTTRPLFFRCAVALAVAVFFTASAWAIDPPHFNTSTNATPIDCQTCHISHFTSLLSLTPGAIFGSGLTYSYNANLCINCHIQGGAAFNYPFVSSMQALPWPGNGTTNGSGSSHRWDSGAAGHLQFNGTNSTGTITSLGVYTGAFAKTYTITITTNGAVGTARFNWSATTPGGGGLSNILTAANLGLDSGLSLQFVNGSNGVSFQTGEKWLLYTRTDLQNPTNLLLLQYITNGLMQCSTCHDEHSEKIPPFDPTAQPYLPNGSGGLISGTNRHFMRVTNSLHQLCNDCHAARAVTNAAFGSHPVELAFTADNTHKLPTTLPLEVGTTNMGCLTCHKIHHGPDTDGKILRLVNSVTLCDDCHTLSDITSAHYSTTNSATLWPGGKFGSLMPARTDINDRGTCINCHAVHGWPTNAANPTIHFEHLLNDYQENFCYTCHGTNGPASKVVYADFQKAYRHPVVNSDSLRGAGRAVECKDCHNSHTAKLGSHTYANTATAIRNGIANAPSLIGAGGVSVNYNSLTNFQAPTPY